jgi:Alr-MurF fusion protein
MNYTAANIRDIINGRLLQTGIQTAVEQLVIDSRRISYPLQSAFFAIVTPRRNGHDFIEEVYRTGVRHFIIQQPVNTAAYPEASFIEVPDTVTALQQLAAHHRRQFQLPVVGITGSNGKTIVKEWCHQLLGDVFDIVRNPKSYNSQIGVPLSLWQIQPHHNLGLFEAGISTTGEMEKLEAMIAPGIGIFTNIGEAHSEGFASQQQKIKEKLLLFRHSHTLIVSIDNTAVYGAALDFQRHINPSLGLFSWSLHQPATLQIIKTEKQGIHTHIEAVYQQQNIQVSIPFTDAASVENALHCWCLLLHLNIPHPAIAASMLHLQPVAMRLEQKRGINNCILINDSYSADLSSLQLALDYLEQQNPFQQKTVVLSDILQSGRSQSDLYTTVAQLLQQKQVSRFIGIGNNISAHRHLFDGRQFTTAFYESVGEWERYFNPQHFNNEVILLKGARRFELEQVAQWLEEKVHQTVMEIHLDRLVHNLKAHQQLLSPETKTMAIVKAFSYGSGSAEVARVLQYHKTDYLAVAYADEGVELRKAGIHLPIMVMNADEAAFDALIRHELEPELYSPAILDAFLQYARRHALQQYPVHIKLDTGMHRLGFTTADMPFLQQRLAGNNTLAVQSVFSHLVGSEDPEEDAFTRQQFELFTGLCNTINNFLGRSFLRHIANSAAIARHPRLQCNMVRLGIGLYGIDATPGEQLALQQVCELKTTIAQIKQVAAGDTVGYNRRGRVTKNSVIATVRIGYADGYPRRLGNGAGGMLVNGQAAPVIGNVCMDMTMLDITGLPNVKEGDYVLVFGTVLPVQQVARRAGTIAYEILAGISQRVKRVYYGE